MAPRTTSALRSHAARSAPEPAATAAAIAVMPSSALPRPAPNSASHSGIILAAGFELPVCAPFHPCPTWYAVVGSPPDTAGCPGFCPYYIQRFYAAEIERHFGVDDLINDDPTVPPSVICSG